MVRIKSLLFYSVLFIFLVAITYNKVYAERGCCSRHNGVCGCNKYGSQVCCDGTTSPTCTCTPPTINGCTDYKADNYNSDANNDDGSCVYTISGCMDPSALNYDSSATSDDGSCKYDVFGCTDRNASNYRYDATKDDGSCIYDKSEEARDYISQENLDNNSSDTGSLIGGTLITVLGAAGFITYKKTKKK